MFDLLLFRLQYGLYNLVWLVSSLPLLLSLYWRYRSHKTHTRRLFERLGFSTKTGFQPTLWIHLASVGEVKGALPLLEHLAGRYAIDELLFTTNTPTGEEILRSSLGEGVHHRYLPFDLPWLMRMFIRRYRPESLILFETELWPALLLECRNANLATLLVNARLSGKSRRKYSRFPNLAREMLASLSLIVAQTAGDADNLASLGAINIRVSGNIKQDTDIDEALRIKAKKLRRDWLLSTPKKIVIAASTHENEEKIILNAFIRLQKKHRDILLLIAPRHPQRFGEVKLLCRKYRLQVVNKSHGVPVPVDTEVVLCDTVGELSLLFGIGDLAIMGGTFIDHGGHNFLEPAVWGVPIVSGKSDYNFRAIAAGLAAAGGLLQVKNHGELVAVLDRLLSDAKSRQGRGRAARQYVDSNRGTLAKLMRLIQPYIR